MYGDIENVHIIVILCYSYSCMNALITAREGFTVKLQGQTEGWKFCFIKQIFQPDVWNFTLKPEQTTLQGY